MNIDALLDNLAELGAVLSIRGNDLDIDAPAGVLTDRDIEALRAAKPELLRLQRIAEGLPPSEAAAECLEWIAIDPAEWKSDRRTV
ncbi:hypothetical protein Poly24_54760 [Rosistilla carotiformis]|uniref:TubC N-terminal docking domain-containing protein n=1 Tax=Rosistilla carotiformis TaxID=2528017 RepID=A0A518K1P7_9BACT|nr:hypothetical protein [Rosistilla carotiformis]QDV71736.1 hypothetical protein Poly24_54760 [Rosistilla carotiformis]